MTKLLITLTLLSQLLFCATQEQIEHYLSVSNAEEELLAMESDFSSMQNSFSKDENTSTYDMQMLSVRFRDYIERHLSENEMTEVLENYKNVVFLQYVSAITSTNYDQNESDTYIASIKVDPEAGTRIELIDKIGQKFNNEESMLIMFDELMKPLMQSAKGGKNLDDAYMKTRREAYIKRRTEASKDETLYATKDFFMEELEELLTIAETPAMGHEVKAVYGATAYALKEFFLSMASRYDVSKHDPSKYNKTTEDGNNTK